MDLNLTCPITSERKAILGKLREELRRYDLVPIIFDFDFPDGRSMIETVGLLARMSPFVLADLSDAKIVINELQDIIPANPSLPVQPIIDSRQSTPELLFKYHVYPAYLEPFTFIDIYNLSNLAEIVKKAEEKASELRERKAGF